MKFQDEILIGEIALEKGLITEEELEECVEIQEERGGEAKMGEILVEKGYLKEGDLPELISIQSEKLDREGWTGSKRRDSMFGRIARRKGYATEDEVNECLRYQSQNRKNGIYFTLGEYMYRKGYLSPEQVQDILAEQGVKILICSECQSQYNIVQIDPDEKFTCKNCHEILQAPQELESLSVVDTLTSPSVVSVGVLRPPKPWILSALVPLGLVVAIFLLLQVGIFTQKQQEVSAILGEAQKAMKAGNKLFKKEQELWDDLSQLGLAKEGKGVEKQRLRSELIALREQMNSHFYRAWKNLQKVAQIDPDHSEISPLLADIHYVQSRIASRPIPGDYSLARSTLDRLSYYDRKERYTSAQQNFQKKLSGTGHLYLETAPGPARYTLYRWSKLEQKWKEARKLVDFADWSWPAQTPLKKDNFPPGSYLLVLEKESFAPLRYPFHLEKGEKLVAQVRLLPRDEIFKSMSYIPGGKFIYGPPGEMKKVEIQGFLIDNAEVTYGEYREFYKNLTPKEKEKFAPYFPGLKKGEKIEEKHWKNRSHLPVMGITHQAAQAYAHSMGKRLPTGREWEKAARGADGRPYPWGWQKDPTFTNISINPLLKDMGPRPYGSNPQDLTVYEGYDFAGNVSEWVKEEGEFSRQYWGIRGANYSDGRWDEVYLYLKARVPRGRDLKTAGFRCVQDLPTRE